MKTTIFMTYVYTVSFMIGGFIGEWLDRLVADQAQFFAIFITVTFDAVLASAKHIKRKQFKTAKSMIFAAKIVAFCALLAVTLAVEAAYPYMNWLSEAVTLPIVVGQILSSINHAYFLKLIDGKIFKEIVDRVDVHKGPSKNE